VKEEGRRFAAVVAQTWNVTDAAAPTLQRQVILEGSLTLTLTLILTLALTLALTLTSSSSRGAS